MPPATTTSCGRPESSFCQFLALGNTIAIHHPEVGLRTGVALLCGEAEPAGGFIVVLRNAFAVEAPVAEAVLRGGVTLLGGEAVPTGGFTVVLRNAFAVAVHEAEAGLRSGVALLCGEAEPANGFTVVLRNAFAVEVPVAEVELRRSVTLGSEAAPSVHVQLVLAADERYCDRGLAWSREQRHPET